MVDFRQEKKELRPETSKEKAVKNLYKSFFVALIAAILVSVALSISGCSKNPETSGSSVSGMEEIKGTIKFATWGSESEIETNKKVIEAFEKEYPGTKVELEYIPKDYEVKIDTLIAGDAAPDVIYGHPYQLRKWFVKGALMDLSDMFESKDLNNETIFDTSFYKNFMHDGKHFGTINGQDIFLLYYNKNLFDKAGVEYPNENWTWDDFNAAAKKLTIVENGKTVQYGVTIGSWYPMAEVFIWSHGGKIVDDLYSPDANVVVDSPGTVAGLQLMQDLVIKDKVAPTPESAPIFGGSFEAGNVAMKFDGAWAPVFLKEIKDFEWDMALVPKGPAGRYTAVLYAGYGVSKNTKNPATAKAFAKFMMSEQGQRILAETGLITVIHKEVSEDPEVIGAPGMPPGNKYRVEGVSDAIWRDAAPLWWHEALDKGFTPQLEALLNGSQDAATTAKNMQRLMGEVRKANK